MIDDIYTGSGYYIYWNQVASHEFSIKYEVDLNFLNKFIEDMLSPEFFPMPFFDKTSYLKHGILTSVELQNIFSRAMNDDLFSEYYSGIEAKYLLLM